MDTVRVEQLLRWAIHSDLMLVQFKLRARRWSPPKFLELLADIRAKEEYVAARVKLNASAHKVQANKYVDSRQMETQTFKADIKEFKSLFTSMSTKSFEDVDDDKGPWVSHPGPGG